MTRIIGLLKRLNYFRDSIYGNVQNSNKTELVTKIRQIKEAKRVTILAHYYQRPEIQELADYVGDSLALSRQAQQSNAHTILFAGVHFMAQTAKILNPASKVLLPDLQAGCSLADSCPPELFGRFLERYPGHAVVTYINCSAEVKAMSDVVCTSSNAERVIASIPEETPIIFAPDKNLGKYLMNRTGRTMILWDGSCVVHEAFAIDKLLELHKRFPKAEILAHPESEAHVLKVAHFVGSTEGILRFAKNSRGNEFIVATEAGILHAMAKEMPDKRLIPAPAHENNTCACSECSYMKLNTLEKLYSCLVREYPVIEVDEALRQRALKPLLRMLDVSGN